MRDAATALAAAAAACLSVFPIYGPLFERSAFVYDDRSAILSNPDVRPSAPWADLLRHDFWGAPLHLA